MNIFFLALLPERNAGYHCNKHVVKMILESAQMLCTAKSICDHGSQQVPPDSLGVEKTYRNVHRNHPCSVAGGVRVSRGAGAVLSPSAR